MALTEFAVVDTETTGLYKNDRIIEIGIVVFNSSEVIDEWTTLLNPSRDVGKTSLHGITPTMLTMAPTFEDVANDILRILNNRVVVAHNYPFDKRMLNQEFERLNNPNLLSDGFCTMTAARRLLGPSNVDLTSACTTLGLEVKDTHTALGDARMTKELFLNLYEDEPIQRSNFSIIMSQMPAPVISRSSFSKNLVDSSEEIKRYLERIPLPTSDEKIVSYFHVLNMALEDLVIDDFETAEIEEWAFRFGITPEKQRIWHRHYLEAATGWSKRDGTCSPEELEILRRIAVALDLRHLVSDLPQANAKGSSAIPLGSKLCFTGQAFDLNGNEILRSQLEVIASRHGFHPVPDVTKSGCDILIASDVNSMSGKTKKAIQYGKSVISVKDFLIEFS